jgi:hypothetical protein
MNNERSMKKGMNRFTTLLVYTLSALTVYGQNGMTGRVTNGEEKPIEAARIELIHANDSVPVSAVWTDADGRYAFSAVANGSFRVRASYFGYEPVVKKAMLFGHNKVKIDFRIADAVVLDEVKIVSTGISVRGDTTAYVVNRFTTGNEKNLKEILERLPHLRIDESTRAITANGKQVQRILLENQDLFQGNTALPLENLSADGIRKVEVIDNYSEYDIFDGFRLSNETVINVGVTDKMRNKIRGELEASGGIQGRYDSRHTLLHIGKQSMFSSMVNSNNIGKQLLRFQDIVKLNGGYNTLLSGDNPMDHIERTRETYAAFIDDRKDTYRRNSSLASLNYIAYPSDKLKVTLNGIYRPDHYRSQSERRYSYLSGAQYDETLHEQTTGNSLLMNIKLQYMPRKDFNIFYTGNLLYADLTAETQNDRHADRLHYRQHQDRLEGKNNLLFVKRFREHSLNLSVDYAGRRSQDANRSDADSTFYAEALGLSDSYRYAVNETERKLSVQLFYLHRIGDRYFFRIGMQRQYNRQTFVSLLAQEMPNTRFDNDNRLEYRSNGVNVKFGKDKGKLTFLGTLGYLNIRSHTDIARRFRQRSQKRLSPAVSIRYAFRDTHHLSVDYQHETSTRPITNLLRNAYLQTYNRVISADIDRLFYAKNSVSLTQILMAPYVGISLMNIASLDVSKEATTENHRLAGATDVIEKRVYPNFCTLSWLSTIEYRFIGIPLNIRLNLNYIYNNTPIYYEDTPYKARLNQASGQLQLTTHYKKGFNGKLRLDLNHANYRGLPVNNRTLTTTLLGQITWSNRRIHAAADVRYRRYRLNHTDTQDLFYGFEARYDVSRKVSLKLSGEDLFHLSERVRSSGHIDSYYAVESRVWYMPGNILCGITWKY